MTVAGGNIEQANRGVSFFTLVTARTEIKRCREVQVPIRLGITANGANLYPAPESSKPSNETQG